MVFRRLNGGANDAALAAKSQKAVRGALRKAGQDFYDAIDAEYPARPADDD